MADMGEAIMLLKMADMGASIFCMQMAGPYVGHL